MAATAGLTSSIVRIKASSSSLSKSRKIRRPQNIDGDFFVDNTCIDCDTCRWMAPEIFNRQDGKSAVYKQPTGNEERMRALQALVSCPTNSIRTEHSPRDILEVHETFPSPIDEKRIQENKFGLWWNNCTSTKKCLVINLLIFLPPSWL